LAIFLCAKSFFYHRSFYFHHSENTFAWGYPRSRKTGYAHQLFYFIIEFIDQSLRVSVVLPGIHISLQRPSLSHPLDKPKGLFPRPRRDMRLTKILVVSGRVMYSCRALGRAASSTLSPTSSSSSSPLEPPVAVPRPKGRLIRRRLTADVYDLGAFLTSRKQLASAGRLTRLGPEAGDMPRIGRLAASSMSIAGATKAAGRRGSVPLETLFIDEKDDSFLASLLALGQRQGEGQQRRRRQQRRIVLEQRGWKPAPPPPPRQPRPGTGTAADKAADGSEDMEWAFFILADIPDGYSYRRSIGVGGTSGGGRGGSGGGGGGSAGGAASGDAKGQRLSAAQREQQLLLEGRERQRQVRERVASAPVYVYRVLTRGGGARVPPPASSSSSQPKPRPASAAAAAAPSPPSQPSQPSPSPSSAAGGRTAAAAAARAKAARSSADCEPSAPGKPPEPLPEPELAVAQYWIYELPRLGGTLWAADEDFCTPTTSSY
jgi:hypothetical protein